MTLSAKIRRHLKNGLTTAETAKKLNCKVKYVYNVYWKMKNPKQWTNKNAAYQRIFRSKNGTLKNQIEARLLNNQNVNDIAKIEKCTIQYVYSIKRKMTKVPKEIAEVAKKVKNDLKKNLKPIILPTEDSPAFDSYPIETQKAPLTKAFARYETVCDIHSKDATEIAILIKDVNASTGSHYEMIKLADGTIEIRKPI